MGLIDRQVAIDALKKMQGDVSNHFTSIEPMDMMEVAVIANCIEGIVEQPTIDAVEVVRCKDCEFYTEEDRWCRRLGLCGAFDQNDYCSHAERRIDVTLN